ncbi:unnamed protein product, partial [Sphagnum jensenii]
MAGVYFYCIRSSRELKFLPIEYEKRYTARNQQQSDEWFHNELSQCTVVPSIVYFTFRITEQGEVITQNLGRQPIAERTFDLFTA